MIRRIFSALLCAGLLHSTTATIQAHEAGKQMAEVATLLISVLTPEQKAKATFGFEDEKAPGAGVLKAIIYPSISPSKTVSCCAPHPPSLAPIPVKYAKEISLACVFLVKKKTSAASWPKA
jgi:hypothetical protein